jgi:phosphate/sulfate permease
MHYLCRVVEEEVEEVAMKVATKAVKEVGAMVVEMVMVVVGAMVKEVGATVAHLVVDLEVYSE